MSRQKNYFNNLLVTFGSSIAFLIAFQTYGLEFTTSFTDFLTWLVWLLNFIGFIVIIKMIFPSIKINSILDGVWGGLIIWVLSPIFKFHFLTNIKIATVQSSIFILVAIILLILGYKLRIKDKNN